VKIRRFDFFWKGQVLTLTSKKFQLTAIKIEQDFKVLLRSLMALKYAKRRLHP
jgi:hypothetical protein